VVAPERLVVDLDRRLGNDGRGHRDDAWAEVELWRSPLGRRRDVRSNKKERESSPAHICEAFVARAPGGTRHKHMGCEIPSATMNSSSTSCYRPWVCAVYRCNAFFWGASNSLYRRHCPGVGSRGGWLMARRIRIGYRDISMPVAINTIL
jgi:hypothetical protein